MEVELWDVLRSRDNQISAVFLVLNKQLRLKSISICASREKYMQSVQLEGKRGEKCPARWCASESIVTVISFLTADSWLSSTCTAGGTLTSQPKVRKLYIQFQSKFAVPEDKLCFSCTNARGSIRINEINKPYSNCDEQTHFSLSDCFF